jgi:HCOMODA/2-hydroxy-3-carboxy-muconic semialdehyde decarboxylase
MVLIPTMVMSGTHQHPPTRRTFFRTAAAAGALCAAGHRLLAQTTADAPGTIEDLVLANHILAAQNVFDAYGHITLRNPANPQRYFMARALPAELVTAEDIFEFDLDSNLTGSKRPDLFVERFLHGEVYKARPDVHSVIHCHTPELLPFGDAGVPLRATFGLAGFIAEGIPLFDIRKDFGMTDLLIRDGARGKALTAVLANKPAALMRGHGAVVVGPTIPIAVGRAVYMQISARVQAQAMAMAMGSQVTYLTPEEGKQSVVEAYRRAWELWRRKALGK